MSALLRVAAAAALSIAAASALAEKADKDKPVNIEADRVSVDDVKKVQVFEGNVQLVKGTLVIRAERIVVTQDDDGYQRGVATGTASQPPRFRQKREGQDDFEVSDHRGMFAHAPRAVMRPDSRPRSERSAEASGALSAPGHAAGGLCCAR